MKNKIEKLLREYKGLRKQSEAMKAYLRSSVDLIEVNAGIAILDKVIEDLEDILK